MYYYWTRKGIRPSVFYSMSPGEKVMIKAFFEEEMAERERMAKAGAVCPMMW